MTMVDDIFKKKSSNTKMHTADDFETICLKAPENEATVSLNLMNWVQTGEWAVSGLNDFCTAAGDIELCRLLAGGALAYPVDTEIE